MVGSTLVVLGGGEGSRLEALTEKRAKPAVPFAGSYRIIDFVLSNALNSSINRVRVLTQYESVSLQNHIRRAWLTKFGDSDFSNLYTLSATLSRDKKNGWFRGTANAVYQNREDIFANNPHVIDVFGGDHIYYMDISQMNNFHLDNNSDFTVAGRVLKVEDAKKRFGVFTVNDRWEALGFEEKPLIPKEIPGMPGYCICSMGNYAAKPEILKEGLDKDHKKRFVNLKEKIKNPERQTVNDFGNDIIPQFLRDGKKIFVYNFMENEVPGQDEYQRGAWWDVGTIGDYWEANRDTLKVSPSFSLYNPDWQVLTLAKYHQPAKVILGSTVDSSLLCNGVISTGSKILNSIIGPGTRTEKGSNIEDVIWFGEGFCEENVTIKNTIIDHGVYIPKGTRIGIDKEEDKARGLKVYDQRPDLTIVPKGYTF